MNDVCPTAADGPMLEMLRPVEVAAATAPAASTAAAAGAPLAEMTLSATGALAGTKRQRGRRGAAAAAAAAAAAGAGGGKTVGAAGGDVLGHLPTPLRRLQVRMKALGMHQRQVVFELHVRQGRSLQVVAEVLGVDYKTAWGHYQKVLEELVVLAPKDARTLSATREQIAARLWATVEETYARAEVCENGEAVAVELPATPQLLSVRLKALDQIAKLYGVNLERCEAEEAVPPYVTPEVVGAAVRARVLALHGRGGLAGGGNDE